MPKKATAPKFRLPSLSSTKVSLDYDTSRSGCTGNCDSYCRCSRITSFVIEADINQDTVAYVIYQAAVEANGFKWLASSHSLRTYAFARLLWLHGVNFKASDFNGRTMWGYYGEEVDGVYFDLSNEKTELVNSILLSVLECETDKDALAKSLLAEYESLPDWFEHVVINVQSVALAQIRTKDIPAVELAKYNGQRAYHDIPTGIVYSVPGAKRNNYWIVDGNHRLARAKNGNEQARVIVFSIKGVAVGDPLIGPKKAGAETAHDFRGRISDLERTVAVLQDELGKALARLRSIENGRG